LKKVFGLWKILTRTNLKKVFGLWKILTRTIFVFFVFLFLSFFRSRQKMSAPVVVHNASSSVMQFLHSAWLPMLMSANNNNVAHVLDKMSSDLRSICPARYRNSPIFEMLKNPLFAIVLASYALKGRAFVEELLKYCGSFLSKTFFDLLYHERVIVTFDEMQAVMKNMNLPFCSEIVTKGVAGLNYFYVNPSPSSMFRPFSWRLKLSSRTDRNGLVVFFITLYTVTNASFEVFKKEYQAIHHQFIDSRPDLPWVVSAIPSTVVPPLPSVRIFNYDTGGSYYGWKEMGKCPHLSLDSVFLPDEDLTKMCTDFKSVNQMRDWATLFNVRSPIAYIFYGYPGSGKTTCIHALASTYGYDIYSLKIGPSVNMTSLVAMVRSLPCFNEKAAARRAASSSDQKASGNERRVMLVLEDFDRLFSQDDSSTKVAFKNVFNALPYNRRTHEFMNSDEAKERVNAEVSRIREKSMEAFSELLNIFDGLDTPQGFVWIGTCNSTKDMTRTMIRDGRVTRRFRFLLPDEEMVERFVRYSIDLFGLKFSPEVTDECLELIMKWHAKENASTTSSAPTLTTLTTYKQIVFRWMKTMLLSAADLSIPSKTLANTLADYDKERLDFKSYQTVDVDNMAVDFATLCDDFGLAAPAANKKKIAKDAVSSDDDDDLDAAENDTTGSR
jgi:hypothetical protein